MEKITVMMVNTYSDRLDVLEMDNTLEALQEAVQGYIEAVRVSDNITMWVNEEGLLKSLPLNFSIIRQNGQFLSNIVGNVVITRVTADGDNASLTPEDIKSIQRRFLDRQKFII